MAIYNIKKMVRLADSKDWKDRQISEFAKRNREPSITYKNYKFLRLALQVEDIQVALTGRGLAKKEEFLRVWLAASKADSQIEQSKKAILCDMVGGAPPEARSLLEGEVKAQTFREYFSIREKIGFMIAKFICGCAGDFSRLRFWKNLSAATMLFDTAVDFFKDRREGLVKNVRPSDFPVLLSRLASYSIKAVFELGIANSIKTLWCPVLMTIKGGFERKSLRNMPWKLSSPTRENMHGISPCPGPLSRI